MGTKIMASWTRRSVILMSVTAFYISCSQRPTVDRLAMEDIYYKVEYGKDTIFLSLCGGNEERKDTFYYEKGEYYTKSSSGEKTLAMSVLQEKGYVQDGVFSKWRISKINDTLFASFQYRRKTDWCYPVMAMGFVYNKKYRILEVVKDSVLERFVNKRIHGACESEMGIGIPAK